MERPVFKPVGTPVKELDTPALVVDLDVLQSNIETLHSFFRYRDAKLRPHVESHRCPAIAHKQLAAGGTIGGISVTTVGQAEVFAQSGFDDIFIANEVVTQQKIDRVCAVAKNCRISLACDNQDNAQDLSEAAEVHDVDLGVMVDIHTKLERCGVPPGRPAVNLAHTINRSTNLIFKGLTTYEGIIEASSPEECTTESRRCIQQVLDTREMIEAEGIEVSVVSAGGTHNYEIAGDMSGVTEVPAGSYALMDSGYREHKPQLDTAARVLGTVISRPESGLAWLDVGQKAISIDAGLPAVDNMAGVTVLSMSAEHGGITLESDVGQALDLGEKVWLTPRDIGACVNVYDYINGVRNGRLEAVWDVKARGLYR